MPVSGSWCPDLEGNVSLAATDGAPSWLPEIAHPAAFFANGLGDTILTLPALRALTFLFPDRLTLICDIGLHALLFHELTLHNVIETAMTRNEPDWTREFAVADTAAAVGACDLFVSLVPWHSRSIQDLLEYLRPSHSLGFSDAFSITAPVDFTKHAADLAFDIPQTLRKDLSFDDFAYPPCLPEDAQSKAESIRAEIGSSFRILVVHADTGPNKMWDADRWVKVLDAFLAAHSDFVVLLVGRAPQPLDTGQLGHRVIPCYGLPLAILLALVARADLFVGVDSSMLHAADFFRVPSVGLFGESNPVEFGFRLCPHRLVRKDRSMASIQVHDVLDALESLWAQTGTVSGS